MLGLVLTVLVLAIAYCVLQCVLLFQDAKRRAGPSIPVFFAPLGVSPWTMLLDIFLTASVFRTGPLWWVTLGGLYRRAKQIWKEANYPDMVCMVSFFPFHAAFIVTDAEVAKGISDLQESITKEVHAYKILEYFGSNIVTTIDDDWRKHRKICTGAFTKSNLRLVRTSTMKHAHHMIDFWKNRSSRNANGEQEYELVLGGSDDLLRLTLGVFGEAIFGGTMDVFSEESLKQDNFCSRLMLTNENLHVALLVPKMFKQWPFRNFQKIDQAFDAMERDMRSMLASAQKDDAEARKDLLSLLSRSNQRTEPLSEREALADVWMFCVAGMETTAHTLGWLLLRLAFHQDVQSKLFAELSHMTEEQVADISAESAPYLFAAVHEALRLHPPVTLVPLEVRKGLDMPVGSLRRVEPKTRMEIHLEMIHLNGRHFENPEVFQPERFLKDGKFEHNPNIVAFNVGPRSCLGKSVAMLELAISAAVLVRSVKIEPVLSWERSSEWITKVTREFRKPTPFKLLLRK